MSTQHWKGPVLPDVGDDLVEAWRTFTDTAGLAIRAQDVASARVQAEAAITAGKIIDAAHPATFIIGGAQTPRRHYTVDGTRASDGALSLFKDDETEIIDDTSTDGAVYALASGQAHTLITSSLPARPYDRAVYADATIFGTITAGGIDLRLSVGSRTKASRYSSGSSSTSVSAVGRVPSGVSGTITVAIAAAAGGGGTIDLSGAAAWNGLSVLAFPVTMA